MSRRKRLLLIGVLAAMLVAGAGILLTLQGRPGHGDPRHDPQEDDPVKGPIIRQVLAVVAEEVSQEYAQKFSGPQLGMCHAIWGRAKERLRVQHGIDWHTPAEMNPHIVFD